MSRGPGKIERTIAALLDSNPDMAVTAEELAERVYGIAAVEHKHIVSVLRALRRLTQRRPDINKTWGRDWTRLHKRGGRIVWFNRRNAQSHGLMMLKTRYCAYRMNKNEKQLSYLRQIRSIETEAELLAMLAPGGMYHRHVQPGGEWYRAVHGAAEVQEAPAVEGGKQLRLLLKALVALGDPGEDQAWSTWAVLYKAWHDPEFQSAIAERVRRWHADEAARAAMETPRALDGISSELDALNKKDDRHIMIRGERLLERRQIRDEMKDASRAFALLEKRGLVARSGSSGHASVTITAAGRALLQSS
jgi:hypothetical protein